MGIYVIERIEIFIVDNISGINLSLADLNLPDIVLTLSPTLNISYDRKLVLKMIHDT